MVRGDEAVGLCANLEGPWSALEQMSQSEREPRVWNKRNPACPSDAVYVGRPSKWGNPFTIGDNGDGVFLTRGNAIGLYETWLTRNEKGGLMRELSELRGRDLVCWCAPLRCHGDVLLRLANA